MSNRVKLHSGVSCALVLVYCTLPVAYCLICKMIFVHNCDTCAGKFSYGLGRPAARRSVLLFSSQSQVGPGHEEYPCAFLGQHRTDSNGTLGPVYLQESIVTQPGHHNVLALLPEDNTCAHHMSVSSGSPQVCTVHVDPSLQRCVFCLRDPKVRHETTFKVVQVCQGQLVHTGARHKVCHV